MGLVAILFQQGLCQSRGEGVFQDTPDWIIDDNPEEQVYTYVFKGNEDLYLKERVPVYFDDKLSGEALVKQVDDMIQASVTIKDELTKKKITAGLNYQVTPGITIRGFRGQQDELKAIFLKPY